MFANSSYEEFSKFAFVTGQNSTWDLKTGAPFAFAIKATTVAMLPPTLLPTTARRLPSTSIWAPFSATHLVAAYASLIATG